MRDDIGFTNGVSSSKSINVPDGMINGNGHTNGMGKGDGHTNGMANNNGMINGNGHTNGMGKPTHKFDDKIFMDKKQKSSKPLIAIFIAVILLMGYILVNISTDDTAITDIDGLFNEWNTVNMIDIGFANLGLISDNKTMQLALERDNILLGDNNVTESYYIFLNDKTSEEGFYLGYKTYEYYIDIYGYNNSLQTIRGYQFDESKENNDWNGFTSKYNTFNLRGANNDSFIEIDIHSIMLGKNAISDLNLIVYHYDTEGGYEYSQIVDTDNVTISNKVKNTRVSQAFEYKYNSNNSSVYITSSRVLAYSSVPYAVRIIESKIVTPSVPSTPTETETPSTNYNVSKKENNNYRGTTFIIEYTHTTSDYVMECGGIVYNSTVNTTLDDYCLTIYGINRTIKNIKVNENTIFTHILNDKTRSGTIDLSTPEPLGSISSIVANEYDATEQDITVDGVIDEYFWGRVPKDSYYVDLTSDVEIITVRNSTHLFLGIISISDLTVHADDDCHIYFDTDNDEISLPDVNDKRLSYTDGGTITYYEGDGSVWSTTTTPTGWLGVKSTTDGAVSFEFVIPISDLNESGKFEPIETTIGFGVKVMDIKSSGGGQHWYNIWYPDNYYSGTTPPTEYMNDPSVWSDLEYGYNFTDSGFVEFSDYDMETPTTTDTITIDGNLDETGWGVSDQWTIDCNGHEAYLYTMKDTTYLYVGWYSRSYNTLGTLDYCQIYFDTDHDNTTSLDLADKVLQIDYTNGTIYGEDANLDGNWEGATMPTGWAGSNGATTGNITWEARFTLTDLNENGYFNSENDSIGFGVMVHHTYDANDVYYLGYPDSCQHDDNIIIYWVHPESWGDLFYGVVVIPEFTEILPMIIFMGGIFTIFISRNKRREIK